MKLNRFFLITDCSAFIALAFCGKKLAVQKSGAATPAQAQEGLKDYYKDYFTIGAAVSPQALKTGEAGLVAQHFNF